MHRLGALTERVKCGQEGLRCEGQYRSYPFVKSSAARFAIPRIDSKQLTKEVSKAFSGDPVRQLRLTIRASQVCHLTILHECFSAVVSANGIRSFLYQR